ncbi:hypothetical protein HIM_06326 [Hirsutella minnesotensis 3608]|uniref:Zn(2)-C6 fungal-type domain-containing protein n=1 Tax=Hirsutella minnesotensis 3608 TaxID=1043627 RepID=A0A0F7ZNT7_9HYPO|nr:hypothetical protein HIM_06326 [Hirsutella minnesotensis 3608]
MAAPSQSTLTQGFSVYQETLGAQLQFFPALGTQQLDDLINAFIPGPASVKEKRASISLDFFEHAQVTGETWRFYPVNSAASVAASPMTGSPSVDSVSSSFNASLVNSSWDWSATASVSSHSSAPARRPVKAASPHSRHQTTDFSSLPGMKILTRDGRDVTNSASRGSKTKEQRDHAHLMRIIKACDSCRRKKIRCDPSHKKRSPTSAQPQPAATAASASRHGKKAKKVSQESSQPQPQPSQPQSVAAWHPEPMVLDELDSFFSQPFEFDPAFSFTGLESLDAPFAAPVDDVCNEFMQFPDADAVPNYDIFLDPEYYFSSQPSSQSPSSLASPIKSSTPQSQPDTMAPPGLETVHLDDFAEVPQQSLADVPGSGTDYTDFNLFSPQSTFSEDDRMLTVGAPLALPEPGMEELVSSYASPRMLYSSPANDTPSHLGIPVPNDDQDLGGFGDTFQSSIPASSARVVDVNARDEVAGPVEPVGYGESALRPQTGSSLDEPRLRLQGGLPESEEKPLYTQQLRSVEANASTSGLRESFARHPQALAEIRSSVTESQESVSRHQQSELAVEVDASTAAPYVPLSSRQPSSAGNNAAISWPQKSVSSQSQSPAESDALKAARAVVPALAPFVANLLSSTLCWTFMATAMSAYAAQQVSSRSTSRNQQTSCGQAQGRVESRLRSRGRRAVAMV